MRNGGSRGRTLRAVTNLDRGYGLRATTSHVLYPIVRVNKLAQASLECEHCFPFTVRNGKAAMKELWLDKHVVRNERGSFQIVGACGRERILVTLDPDVMAGVPADRKRSAIESIQNQIQDAARRKYRAKEAYPVYYPYSTRFKHSSIALNALDLNDPE